MVRQEVVKFQVVHWVTMYDVFQCLVGDACDRYRSVVRRRVSRSFLEHWYDSGMLPFCWYSSLVKWCLVYVCHCVIALVLTQQHNLSGVYSWDPVWSCGLMGLDGFQ